MLLVRCAGVCLGNVAAIKSQEKTTQKNCSLLPFDILTAPRNVAMLFVLTCALTTKPVLCMLFLLVLTAVCVY